MNVDQFFKHITATFEECKATLKAKNSDYSEDNPDPFGNFRQCENFKICPVENGILVRMSDKMARITSLTNKSKRGEAAAVSSEAIRDTLQDLINYAAILDAYIASQKG